MKGPSQVKREKDVLKSKGKPSTFEGASLKTSKKFGMGANTRGKPKGSKLRGGYKLKEGRSRSIQKTLQKTIYTIHIHNKREYKTILGRMSEP